MDKEIVVTLAESELWLGRKVAEAIQKEAQDKGRIETAKAHLDTNKDSLTRDIEGITGEIAVAKALGLYYRGLSDLKKGPDLGAKNRGDLYTLTGVPFQIRATAYPWGRLYIRPNDESHKEQAVILVTTTHRGILKEWAVRGWIVIKEAMVPKYWIPNPKNGRPPYWQVPQADLLSMGTFNRL